jgi:hypothetical protein
VPTYTAKLVTRACVDQAFAYLARFDNTVQWDPGVVSAWSSTPMAARLSHMTRFPWLRAEPVLRSPIGRSSR